MKRTTKIAFVITALTLSNVLMAGFLIHSKATYQNTIDANPYPLIDPARNIIDKKHFLSTLQPLREEFYQIVEDAKPNKVGIYYEYLNTGSNISINQDSRFLPASLTKLPTALVVMKKIEDGEWKLTNELVLFEEDKDPRFGNVYKKPVGTRFTIEALLKEILINSDNTAHRILVRNLASDEYTDMLEALGMEQLFNEDYDITAKEYSRLFRVLYNASYLDREHSQQVLTWLTQTSFNDYLRSNTPKDIAFSHKIGQDQVDQVFLDSGIVYLQNRPYLITVMVKVEEEGGENAAKRIMQKVSKAAYKYVKEN